MSGESGEGGEVGEVASVSVVVPVYNSEGSLRQLVDRLQPVLTARGAPFESLLVNDGSRERSWPVVSGQLSLSVTTGGRATASSLRF